MFTGSFFPTSYFCDEYFTKAVADIVAIGYTCFGVEVEPTYACFAEISPTFIFSADVDPTYLVEAGIEFCN